MIWSKGISHITWWILKYDLKEGNITQAGGTLLDMLGEPLLEQPLMFLGHFVFGAFLGRWSLRLLPESSWWVGEPDYCSRGVAWVTCNVTGCADSHPNQVPPPKPCNAMPDVTKGITAAQCMELCNAILDQSIPYFTEYTTSKRNFDCTIFYQMWLCY